MTTCPTTSGPYRCEREAGHAGECACSAREYNERRHIEHLSTLANIVDKLDKRVHVLEQQVASLQMSAPRGIPK
jgi:hypothetical protein